MANSSSLVLLGNLAPEQMSAMGGVALLLLSYNSRTNSGGGLRTASRDSWDFPALLSMEEWDPVDLWEDLVVDLVVAPIDLDISE